MLKALQKIEKDGAIQLLDAAIMSRSEDTGKLTIGERSALTGKKGLSAVPWLAGY